MATYKIVRTNSGEDVIGKRDGVNSLINPAIIVIRPGQDGAMNVMLVPFMPFAKDYRSTFPNMDDMITCEPEDGILAEYKKIFDPEAIIVPDNKIILH